MIFLGCVCVCVWGGGGGGKGHYSVTYNVSFTKIICISICIEKILTIKMVTAFFIFLPVCFKHPILRVYELQI